MRRSVGQRPAGHGHGRVLAAARRLVEESAYETIRKHVVGLAQLLQPGARALEGSSADNLPPRGRGYGDTREPLVESCSRQ
jgi:hypothetical protein